MRRFVTTVALVTVSLLATGCERGRGTADERSTAQPPESNAPGPTDQQSSASQTPDTASQTATQKWPIDEDTPADAVRPLVMRKCGKCHDGNRDSAIPAALGIFDLTDEQWWAGLSHGQLDQFPGQFERMSDDLSDAQRERIGNFVAWAKDQTN